MASTTLTTKISDLSTRVGEEIARRAIGSVTRSPADTREDTLSAGSEFETPEYVMGANQLKVYLDGVLCSEGETYVETSSTSIAFVDDIPASFDITARVG